MNKCKDFLLKEFSADSEAIDSLSADTLNEYQSMGLVINTAEALSLKTLMNERGINASTVFLAAFMVFLRRLNVTEGIIVEVQAGGEVLSKHTFDNLYPQYEISLDQLLSDTITTENQSGKKEIENQGAEPVEDFEFVFYTHGEEYSQSEEVQCSVESPIRFFIEDDGALLQYGFKYSAIHFESSTITRLLGYFEKIIHAIAEDTTVSIGAIEILDSAEKNELLNSTRKRSYDFSLKNVVSLFEDQAEINPEHTALIYHDSEISYAELNRRANRLANYLISQGISGGSVVGLMISRSIDMIVGLLGIMKTGASYLPLDEEMPAKRIMDMLSETDAGWLLTDRTDHEAYGEHIHILDVRADIADFSSDDPKLNIHAEDTAYILYTSGSTGRPKGAVIVHKALTNLILSQTETFGVSDSDRILQFSSIVFDASVEQIWLALTNGATLVLIDKETLLDDRAFGNYIEQKAITHLDVTPTFLESRTLPANGSLQRIVVGGEAAKIATIEKLVDRYDVYNAYGPTEATVTSTVCKITPEMVKSRSLPIGSPIHNTAVYLLGPKGELLPEGCKGELHIGGYGLANGYINNQQLTAEKFITHPHIPGERIYKTGDLARRLPDGNIEYLGRIDSQLKIRGFRIEPGEIEHQLATYSGITEVAVVAQEVNNDKVLVAYYVASSEIDEKMLSAHLAESLPEHMIPAFYTHLTALPLNLSGKLDVRALPLPDHTLNISYVGPATPTEEQLTIIWGEVLKLDAATISTDRSFFSLGGHSLKAGFLVNKIHQVLKVEVPLSSFFKNANIKMLAEYIDARETSSCEPVKRASRKSNFVLSSAQRRLLYLYDLNKSALAYNMPQYLRLTGRLDQDKLAQSFIALIRRHESLRTYFVHTDDGPVQCVADDFPFTLETYSTDEKGITGITKAFVRSFDLGRAPLLRAGLVEITDRPEEYLLMIDAHHIVNDGISEGIMIRDLTALYKGDTLPELEVHYKDYAEWEQSEEQKKLSEKDKAFWLAEYSDELSPLNLPQDYPRPLIKGYEGDTQQFTLDKETTETLKQIASAEGTTLYTVLLSAFNILLSRLSNQEDIIIGTPTAGRSHADLEDILGMFVNTLPVRNYPEGTLRLTDFIRQVHERTLKSFDHQHYGYEDLVQALNIPRDPSRNPLFDVVFVLQNYEGSTFDLPGITVQAETDTLPVAKFDLTLEGRETADGQLNFNLEYSTDLFKAESITRFISYFKRIVAAILNNTSQRLSEIEILSAEEQEQLTQTFNETGAGYPTDKTVTEHFESSVQRSPESVALVSQGQEITYETLNRKANAIAHELRAQGIQRGDIVCVLGGQTAEVIYGILGILKSGAAFLPVDADYPKERISYILEDSGHKALLSYPEAIAKTGYEGPYIDLQKISLQHTQHAENPVQANSASDTAYVIYTSGSTGKPKGTLVGHASLVNLCFWHNEYYEVTSADRSTKYAGIGFDASVWEIFPYLLQGATIHLIDESVRLDVEALNTYYNTHGITLSFLPSQVCEQFVKQENTSLRMLLAGGDKLKTVGNTPYTVVNNYGPTENTVVTTAFKVKGNYQNIPIGRPIANNQIYILNRYNSLSPVGVAGELCISGAGLAQGYLHREDLTAEKFVTNPITGTLMYRTGDLARWLADGNIEYLGRIDGQVKIRGNRIELGEIENTLLNHDGIEQAVVSVSEKHGDKQLVAYYVANSEIEVTALKASLGKQLPKYMVPSFFMALDTIPLTANGKVNKRLLPEPEYTTGEDFTAPANDTEERLVRVWADVLKLDKAQISTSKNFFELGGHSLNASFLVNSIHRAFNTEFSLQAVFEYPSIVDQAAYILKAEKKGYLEIQKAEADHYTLSSVQQRLHFLYEIDKQSLAYNIPQVFQVRGEIDKDRLSHAFEKLIHRHSSLRTSFEVVDGMPVQKITDHVDFHLEHLEAGDSTTEDVITAFIRPFDLTKAPLMRAGLIELGHDHCILILDTHHIINDGISQGIINKELTSLYKGEQLPDLQLEYKDYAVWQQKNKQAETTSPGRDFWLAQFADEVTPLDLPVDFARPLTRTNAGDLHTFEVGALETAKLKEIADNEGVTLYLLLLAGFNILLSKLSNQHDIVIGTPTAGRTHADLDGVVGMFVDTIPIRNHTGDDITFKDFLKAVRQNTLSCFDHQDYSYDQIIKELDISREGGRNPLFDVLFVYQNFEDAALEIAGAEVKTLPHKRTTSKFDLTLEGTEQDGRLQMGIEFSTELFRDETIARIESYLVKILNTIINNPAVRLGDIDIIPAREKDQLLNSFNATKSPYPSGETVISLFENQALKTPDNLALKADENLTYKELSVRSGQVAALLTEQYKVQKGDLIGILLDRETWLVPVIFGIMKAGAAYIPIDAKQPADRINAIVGDAGITVLITKGSYKEKVAHHQVIDLDTASGAIEKQMPAAPLALESTDLAYIIYTSGSTGTPKGVMIEHGSLSNIIHCMQERYPLEEGDSFLLKTTYAFDVSVAEIFGWFLKGGSLTILENGAEADSNKILKTIASQGITHINFAPSMFSLFLEEAESDGTEVLNNLKYIFVAGEALPLELVRKYNKLNISALLENIYGPTEATIYSTGYSTSQLEGRASVPIGKPLSNIKCYVLNTAHQLQPLGVPGELCIGGAALARGYLHNPSLTHEKFIANPFVEGERIYKTGDLVKWLPDGNIEYLGRIDHQVKIRGFRIELGEIENHLSSHEQIKEVVVISRGAGSNQYIAAYYVADVEISPETLKKFLESKLPYYMIPQYFVHLEALPLNASGKVNRKALPEPEITQGDNYIAPATPTEEQLTAIWGEVLKLDAATISTDQSFFSLGGHSLKAGFLVNKIHRALKVEIPLSEFFKYPTIKALAAFIEGQALCDYVTIEKVEPKEHYKLSSVQQRLLYLYDLDRSSIAYNTPQYHRLTGEVDQGKLAQSFIELIRRHESLRTYFVHTDEGPAQYISDDFPFTLETYSTDEKGITGITKAFVRSFDLGRAPLLRAGLVTITDRPEEYLLMIDAHHIVNDGISEGIMIRDLTALYKGDTLPELEVHYKDYAEWEQSEEQKKLSEKDKAFWLAEYSDEFSPLNLPQDYPRPLIKGYEGDTQQFTLDQETTETLKQIAATEGTTLYTVLLSAFNILLSRLSNQEDIIIGTPTAGRSHADLEDILGMFVNTLPVRNYPEGTLRLTEFIRQVHERTLKSFDHQHYGYEDLVQALNIPRDPSRNPLFDVVFVLQNYEGTTFELPGITVQAETDTLPVAKFDLTLEGRETANGQLNFNLEYSTDLFKAESITRFISYFKRIVAAILNNTSQRLSEIEILSAEEQEQLTQTFNETGAGYPTDKTVTEHFESSVQRSPESVALVSQGEEITYEALNRKANAIAHELRAQGIQRGDIVCVLGGQIAEVIYGVLGILKSGAAFLPVDADYPKERISYILEDSGHKALLSYPEAIAKTGYEGAYIDLQKIALQHTQHAENPVQANSASDTAYVIYTSGSTGKPKGTLVGHHSLVNLCFWHNEYYEVTSADRSTKYAGIGFDASVWEIFPYLLQGATIHLIDESVRLDVEALNTYYNTHGITISFLPSQVCEQFVKQENTSLRMLLAGGDKLKTAGNTPYTVVNNYGPTENTVVTTAFKVKGNYQNIPIGRPIANNQIYILNRYNSLSPVGVAGELCISGAGLAQGYLHREDLTAEKFVTNPLTGTLMYRTGDLARWLADGNIEYLGRIDGQVKIRGNRIELGEIENTLLNYDGIEQAVVSVSEKHGDKQLVAYYVANSEVEVTALKASLGTQLPKYMVPSFFMALDTIPLTANGKVNKRLLPEPEYTTGEDFTAPANDTEERLVQVWADVLKLDKAQVSTSKSFYDTGGHSLNAATMLNKVHKEFDVKISFQEFFAKPTITLLAEHIEVHTWLQEDSDETNKFEITI